MGSSQPFGIWRSTIMSGTYRHLSPGRYHLVVQSGHGPAGVRRPDGQDIIVGVEGGAKHFHLADDERVYYWWRGPAPRDGVRLTPARQTDTRRVEADMEVGSA
jgi:hypothetical protein